MLQPPTHTLNSELLLASTLARMKSAMIQRNSMEYQDMITREHLHGISRHHYQGTSRRPQSTPMPTVLYMPQQWLGLPTIQRHHFTLNGYGTVNIPPEAVVAPRVYEPPALATSFLVATPIQTNIATTYSTNIFSPSAWPRSSFQSTLLLWRDFRPSSTIDRGVQQCVVCNDMGSY